ncbi:DUF4364 family protein [uncultured Oscillibacter sp.]|uniref:DUF4364 family protein n=1 Tax=uncultured Oscillibacter sp. TaxID=876091 RepID=UPI0025DDAC66|nr:DUF4364 family protein [uncultured Oscillibacter sp.]
MAGRGFIHDKLEIKFLILYIAARVIQPIPFDTVLDLTMCDDAIDYFDFSECLNDLVKTEHLTLSGEGLYAITEKGVRNSQICESSLPYSVRLRCDKNLSIWNRKLRRKSQVRAATEKRDNGTYTVRLSLDDDMGSVMDLQLMVVREDMAKVLSDRFRKEPEKLYSKIMDLLLSDEEEN